VSIAELRRRFNTGRFEERALVGGYGCCLRDRYATTLADAGDPVESLLIGWTDEAGRLRFYAHGFFRADGAIIASGLLDPKLLLDDDGVYYKLDQ
jgi:hypothetical protein